MFTSRSYYLRAVFILFRASDCVATIQGQGLFDGTCTINRFEGLDIHVHHYHSQYTGDIDYILQCNNVCIFDRPTCTNCGPASFRKVD